MSEMEMVLFMIPSQEPPLDNLNEIKPIPGSKGEWRVRGPNPTKMLAPQRNVLLYVYREKGTLTFVTNFGDVWQTPEPLSAVLGTTSCPVPIH